MTGQTTLYDYDDFEDPANHSLGEFETDEDE
jgi:hypothetical protein